MKPSFGWLHFLVLLVCACAGGCGLGKQGVDQKLQATQAAPSINARDEHYCVGCPDVLEVVVMGQPGWCGQVSVNPEGRILLGSVPGLRVEDHSLQQIAGQIACAAHVPVAHVQVRVAQFNSKQLYVHGEVEGKPRAIPYQGPETLLEVLKRVGVSPGAAPGDIQLVRANIAAGGQPEVFPVDLSALIQGNDSSAQLRVEPFDQIYIGQTKKCHIEQCMPPVLKPLFESLCGMYRPNRSTP